MYHSIRQLGLAIVRFNTYIAKYMTIFDIKQENSCLMFTSCNYIDIGHDHYSNYMHIRQISLPNVKHLYIFTLGKMPLPNVKHLPNVHNYLDGFATFHNALAAFLN